DGAGAPGSEVGWVRRRGHLPARAGGFGPSRGCSCAGKKAKAGRGSERRQVTPPPSDASGDFCAPDELRLGKKSGGAARRRRDVTPGGGVLDVDTETGRAGSIGRSA